MESNQMDRVKIRACRVCLDSNFSSSVNITDSGAWFDLFEYCFGLSITSKDLSKEMCNACASSLKSYAKFKKLCHETNKFWESLLNKNLKCDVEKYMAKIEKVRKKLVVRSSKDDLMCDDFKNIDIKTEKCDIQLDNVSYTNDYDSFCAFDIAKDECIDSKPDIVLLTKSEEPKKECSSKKRIKSIKQKNVRRNIKTYNKFSIPQPNYCGLCEYLPRDVNNVKDHLEEHRTKNDLYCKTCGYTGVDFACMVAHRYQHLPEGYKKLKCYLCSKICLLPLSLEYHYRSVHLAKTGGLCTICNKVFKNYIKFRNHQRLHDKSTKVYICDHCGKEFLFRCEIEAHWADVSDVKSYICDTCGKTFKRLRNMVMHQSTVHVVDPIKCNHCNKTFKNKISLDTHMKMFGGTKKDLACEICSKTFVKAYSLKRHMIWHIGERPYECELCGVKYKVKNQLTIHMRRHTGILPFKCAYCSRCFPSSNQKKVHESVHTGQRAYKCLYCERSFHNRKLLEAHCVARHKTFDKKISNTVHGK